MKTRDRILIFATTLWVLVAGQIKPIYYNDNTGHGYYNSYHPHYENDGMGKADKEKIRDLAAELIRDSQMKQRQILAIQRYHSPRVPFEIGIIIGRIRARYRRMMDFYKEMHDRRERNIMLYIPGVWFNKPYHYLMGVELVRTLEQDIDQTVHVLELIPDKYLDRERKRVNMSAMRPPKTGRMGNRPEEQEEDGRKFANEQELKSYYRDKYDKNQGHDHNWTLDQYYGL